MGKTSGPEPSSVQRKMKATMIWKKGWKGWKKLHSFGNNNSSSSNSSGKIIGKSDLLFRLFYFIYEKYRTQGRKCEDMDK